MRIDPHLGKEGRPPADRPVGPHSSVLPLGVDYAVHADHTVAAQRSRLAVLGGAPGLSRAEENGMTLDQLDRYLRKQTAARGARGKKARKSAAKNCARILEIHEPGADCEAMPNSRPCKRAVAARARSTARGGELPRIFAISDRKDYKDFVRDELVELGAAQESDIPNFKGSYLGRFPLVSADFWTSDHLSERSRSVDVFSGTRARGTLTLKRR
jgi:hypothetical protein